MTNEVNGASAVENDELTPEQEAEFQELLQSLFGGAQPTVDPAVEARYDELVPSATAAHERLTDELDAGQEHDFTVTVSTSELRAILAALGQFVGKVIFSTDDANKVLDTAEVVIDAALNS